MNRKLILPAVLVAALVVFFLWKKPFAETREDAMELYDAGKYSEALAIVEKLLHKDSDDAILRFDRGVLRAHLGDFEGSIDDLSQVLDKHPEHDICRLERANVYNNIEDPEKAMSDIDYLLKAKNNGSDAPMWTEESEIDFDWSVTMTEIIYHRGITNNLMEKFQEAYNDFTTCIDDAASPTRQFNLSDAYYWRGEVMIRSGQTELGCADVQKAIDLGHSFAHEIYADYCQ